MVKRKTTKSKLTNAAVQIGSAVGRMDNKAHTAAHVAKQELAEMVKQLDALKKQMKKSTQRLKKALA